MKFNETLEKLEKWIDVIQKSILIFAGIETIIVIIIGVASSNIYHEKYSTIWIGILVVLGFIYLTLTIIKISYNKTFPSSIIEELNAKKDLEIAYGSISRKDAINSYISNTILDLSNCKCGTPKPTENKDWRLDSDEDFITGIKSITKTLNTILNVLLNTSTIKFSTGIYVDYFRGFNHENLPQSNKGTFLIRDDFELNESGVFRTLMENNGISDLGLDVQNAIKVSYNNGQFYVQNLNSKNELKAIIVCANIENLKTKNEQKGVLFIISKPLEQIPDDIESVMKMFTNIISHWLDLYEHEVVRRQIEIMGEEIEEEDNIIE